MPRKKVVIRKNIIVRIVIVIVTMQLKITNVTITILTITCISFLWFPDEKKRVKSYIYKYIIYIYIYSILCNYFFFLFPVFFINTIVRIVIVSSVIQTAYTCINHSI